MLLTTEQFGRLASALMADLEDLDIFAFKVAVDQNVGVESAQRNYSKWEQTFCARLADEVRSGRFDSTHDLNEDDAQIYIDDFLETQRVLHLRISYTTGSLHDRSDSLLNITLHRPQSTLQRILNRYGEIDTEISILRSDIRRLVGTSADFVLQVGAQNYHFGTHGFRAKVAA